MKLVSIITVNYNHSAVTESLLNSIIEKNNYSNIEVVVVDNASKVNPVPTWVNQYPAFVFIRSEENLGFAGGNNLGLTKARGDYLFFINNDTEVTETLVEQLVASMDSNPSIGIISPKIHYYEQPLIIQYAGYTPMNYITGRNACTGQFEEDRKQYDHLTGKVGYAHGAAMMVSREAVQKTGGMEEIYFLYYEELDWCERIRKAGFEVCINMQALIYHKESMSVGKNSSIKEYYMNRNRLLFMRKHAPRSSYPLFFIYFTCIVVPRNIINYLKEKQYSFIPLLLKSIWWNITHKADSKTGRYIQIQTTHSPIPQ